MCQESLTSCDLGSRDGSAGYLHRRRLGNKYPDFTLLPTPSPPSTSRWQNTPRQEARGRGFCDAVLAGQCLGGQSMTGKGVELNWGKKQYIHTHSPALKLLCNFGQVA